MLRIFKMGMYMCAELTNVIHLKIGNYLKMRNKSVLRAWISDSSESSSNCGIPAVGNAVTQPN